MKFIYKILIGLTYISIFTFKPLLKIMVYIDRFKKLEEAEERRRQEEEERARKMKEQVSVCNQPIKVPIGRKLYIISCINHIFLICCGFFFYNSALFIANE